MKRVDGGAGPRARPMPLYLPLLAAVALAACGGGVDAPPVPTPPTAAALHTASPGQLVDYVRARLRARGPQGTATAADQPPWASTMTTASGNIARSGTLVQEAGVDEPDWMKADLRPTGTRLVTLQPLGGTGLDPAPFAQLVLHGVDAHGQPQRTAAVDLRRGGTGWTSTHGLLVSGDGARAAVVADSTDGSLPGAPCPPGLACTMALPWRPSAARVEVQIVDLPEATTDGRLPVTQRLAIDGRVVGARRVGQTLVLVTTHAPALAYDALPPNASHAERDAVLASLRAADLLPQVRVDGGAPLPLLQETDCWLQPANASLQVAVTTVTLVDLGTLARSSRCVVGGTEALTMSASAIYLATSRMGTTVGPDGVPRYAQGMQTDLHKLAFDGRSVTYRASGTVDGHLGWDRARAAYRLSEQAGDLRVLSFTGDTGWRSTADAATVEPSPATLTVLRERSTDASLQPVGRLPNARRPAAIGKPGEQVYAVRFVGERGYVVTFRQTDPLYVLDLADPTDPRVAGELEVPGFSDWLFPLEGGLLFGVGQEATAEGQVQGVKVTLFDVRDAAAPRLLDSRRFGAAGSFTGLATSPHALDLLNRPGQARLAFPMSLVPEDSSGSSPPEIALQRFEVDTGSRRLAVRGALPLGSGWQDLSATRSLQTGDAQFIWHQGVLTRRTW